MRATKQGTESNVAQQHVAKTRDIHTYVRKSKEDIVGGDKARKEMEQRAKCFNMAATKITYATPNRIIRRHQN